MKAFVLEQATGPDGTAVRDVPAADPGPGEVRVRLDAAALNHRELWISLGQYPGMKLPCILGADGAGVVEAVGPGADPALFGRETVLYPALNWGSDQRYPSRSFCLLGMPPPGTIAQSICVPQENVALKPAHLSFVEAAALPTAAVTAWRGLTVKAGLKPGEKLLLTGIGGGVAGIALQFATALGAEVYVTSGADATIAKAVAMGAKAGFNYREPDWRKALAKASGGIDVVLDGSPAAALSDYMRALNVGARVVIYGSTAGVNATMSAPDLFLRHATVFGTAMGSPEDFRAMLAFVAEHRIVPVIERSFDLDAAREALVHLRDHHGFGKVVVRI